MELAFLTNAIRRYYWLIILGGLLGALPGLVAGLGGEELYESRAVLLIAPPSQSALQVSFSGDPDRYVSGQLSVLRSQVLSERVAQELDDLTTAADVAASVRFEQAPLTDIVTIVATADDPEEAKALADAYLDVYFQQLRDQLDATQEPDLQRIEGEITTVRQQLESVDQQMVEVMEPYLDDENIPALEQVAPGLISEKQILLGEYTELLAQRAQLSSGLRISSEIVQRGTLSTDPVDSSKRLLVVVGGFGGVVLGLLAAIVVGRLSPSVQSDDQVEEILQHPVVGRFPFVELLEKDRTAVFSMLTPAANRFVEGLCVRAEAAAEGRATLSVVVTGATADAGTTTVAAALARRLAEGGSTVLLVDADRHHPELTLLDAQDEKLLTIAGSAPGPTPASPLSPDGGFLADNPNLRVMGLARLQQASADESGSDPSRRIDAAQLMSVAAKMADVVVFDGGELMASAHTLQLSWLCDAVVLTMPERLPVRELEVVGNELRALRTVLPVWGPSRPRTLPWRASR